MDRETIVRKLAIRDKDIEMPQESEGKPFSEYLQYAKSANGEEEVKRDWLVHCKSTNVPY